MKYNESFIYKYALTVFRGISMGLADVLPGVSGSTIALITGIYSELINAIKSIDRQFINFLVGFKFLSAFKHIDGAFLLPLSISVIVGMFIGAKIISLVISQYPIHLFSLLSGLIIGASIILLTEIKLFNIVKLLVTICGITLVVALQLMGYLNIGSNIVTFYICGFIAGTFMIFPGISGSLALVNINKYEEIVNAISSLQFSIIIPVGLGALTSILLVSRMIHYFFNKIPDYIRSFLVGLMLGSLMQLWPWKTNVTEHSVNISPSAYYQMYSQSPEVLAAICLVSIGLAIPLVFKYTTYLKKQSTIN